jgi:hypothetical protein
MILAYHFERKGRPADDSDAVHLDIFRLISNRNIPELEIVQPIENTGPGLSLIATFLQRRFERSFLGKSVRS